MRRSPNAARRSPSGARAGMAESPGDRALRIHERIEVSSLGKGSVALRTTGCDGEQRHIVVAVTGAKYRARIGAQHELDVLIARLEPHLRCFEMERATGRDQGGPAVKN